MNLVALEIEKCNSFLYGDKRKYLTKYTKAVAKEINKCGSGRWKSLTMVAVLQYSQTLCAEEHSRYRLSNMAGCQLSFTFDWFNDRKYILALNWNVKSFSVSKINHKRYSVWTWKEITRCLNSCVSCWIQFGSRSANSVIYIFILVAQRRNEFEIKKKSVDVILTTWQSTQSQSNKEEHGLFHD